MQAIDSTTIRMFPAVMRVFLLRGGKIHAAPLAAVAIRAVGNLRRPREQKKIRYPVEQPPSLPIGPRLGRGCYPIARASLGHRTALRHPPRGHDIPLHIGENMP